jgi:hypothetical protein
LPIIPPFALTRDAARQGYLSDPLEELYEAAVTIVARILRVVAIGHQIGRSTCF